MRQVVAAVNAHRHVQEVIDLQTMHLGPEQVLVGIEVHLRDSLNTDELEEVINEIELAVRAILPQADHLFVEARAPDGTPVSAQTSSR